MIGSRSFLALMRRNLIYRYRNWIGTIFELVLPVVFVVLLVLIKKNVENGDGFAPETFPAFFPANEDAVVAFSFTDYVTAMRVKRFCELDEDSFYTTDFGITGIRDRGNNWQVPFVKCDSRKCTKDGEEADLFCEYLALGVAPLNSADGEGLQQAEKFRDYVYETYPELVDKSEVKFDFDFIQMFESDEALKNYVTSSDYSGKDAPKLALGIVFDGTDDSFNYSYRIRVNSTNFNSPENEDLLSTSTTPPTDRLFGSFARTDVDSCQLEDGAPWIGSNPNSCTFQYIYNGALTIQRLVGDWVMDATGAKSLGYFVAEHGVSYASFAEPEYEESGFYASISEFVPLLITLGLLYPVSAMVRYITLEKELRQKELMKMMSVTESDIGWSWFLSLWGLHFVSATIVALVSTQLWTNSDFGQIWIFWEFTMLAVVVFSMFIAAFFSKSTPATLVGLLVFFAGYFLTLIVSYDEGNTNTIALISLHPVGAFSFGLQEIGRLEDLQIGLNADTNSSTDSPSGYTFNNTLQSLIFDCVLWGVLSWYFNRVIQGDFGQALPWYFPFTSSYWCPGRAKAHPQDDTIAEVVYDEGLAVEPVPDAVKEQMKDGKSIEIRNLRKTFGEKTAVDGLSMSMYRNQITALLGHNGAGKTTTISMLTGMIAPTEGHATIAGKDIRSDMGSIRQELGICLQHDCLFPELTVREHIQLFSRIKGMYTKMSYKEAEEKVDASIEDVALSEKRNSLSKNLSGGMKRKLSVAIAFCGDSKTVLLDEPTSGMDPFSRRFTWNVIRQYRKDRCIILTTHFMDEADILGDRIAIMAEGQLRCLGSALFLKKTYGVGYQLTIEKQPESKSPAAAVARLAQDEIDDKLTEIVKGAVSEANLLSNVGSELSFQLPLGAASNFITMFDELDTEVEKSTIVTYGVGITTLDEVFLLVARGGSAEKDGHSMRSSIQKIGATQEDDAAKSMRSRMELENEGLFSSHVSALFSKRALNFKRDKKAWVCTTILPSLFVLIGFCLFKFISPSRNLDALVLDLGDYNKGLETNRNPISFNVPDSVYTCQPGRCIYEDPYIENEETGEMYYFCGANAYLGDFGELPDCSIQDSEKIVSSITDAGAFPVAQEASNVLESSLGLVESAASLTATQYGGIYFTHDPSSIIDQTGIRYNDSVIAQCQENQGSFTYSNAEACENYGGLGYSIRYNYTAMHVTPTFQNLADEAIVKLALGDDTFRMRTTLHPFPLTKLEENLGEAEDGFTPWFLIVLSFPFISGSFATFVVSERQSKAKHLQTVAGVKPAAYWISTWLWDVANYQIPLWITVILMFAFDINILTTTNRGVVGGVIALLFAFGPAAASFTYCFQFLFTSPSICNLVIIISSFLIGLGGSLAAFILRLLGSDTGNPKKNLVFIADLLEWILRFIPAFNLSKGLFNTINISTFEFLEGEDITVWDDSVLLYEVIFLVWQSFGYLFLAIKIDEWSANPRAVTMWQNFIRCGVGNRSSAVVAAVPEDSDVMAEEERVLSGGANDDLIVLSQLSKVFDNGKVAVNNMSLGIPPGQCFGLLGINGAGKTTTMGMLTAEFPPSGGDATLARYSVSREPEMTRRRVGYCPQFDAHFTNLTGREHVELYAKIKGVPIDLIKEASSAKLVEVGLSDIDKDRLAAGYSGGMKRRLSLACATIGQPQIVFLDECSTGVDPVARREIWKMISDMVTGGNLPLEERTSVILTTHSMEECEALCPNIGIMAGGKLRCLGSAQHLKSKFGQGFQVEMKIKNIERTDSDYLENLAQLAKAADVAPAAENGQLSEEVFLNLEKTHAVLTALTGDDFLAAMVSESDPAGYSIYKDAKLPLGVELAAVALFATGELRMRSLNSFVQETFPSSVVRERQDSKARYEVSNDGVKISNIFASIEENKERLLVSEYGVSQTSLEQVFNMHAAEAERLKYGTNDA